MKSPLLRAFAFTLSIVAAGPALALSCSAPSVAGAYGFASDSPDNYVIAVGGMNATGPSNPPQGAVALGGDINNMQGYTQQARFDGMLFTGNGFTQAWNQQILVEVSCSVAWCGQYNDHDDALYFFRQEANGSYTLQEDACPGNVFANPTNAELRQVSQCYQNGNC